MLNKQYVLRKGFKLNKQYVLRKGFKKPIPSPHELSYLILGPYNIVTQL